ncbi:MAG TPA: PQQ-dependent sugar dehydrogenase [Prolixibacteraceae bacterium]|nr:PQQ-dependent sugar dehydrogenase [Prolixibacteraceae bacterium]
MENIYKFLWLLVLMIGFNTSYAQSDEEQMVVFATGISNPVSITHAGDSRLFVVDQQGQILIVDSAGNVHPEPFLDITDKVIFQEERGLLGLAFHPDYATNGYFYVNYVGQGNRTNISRFKVSSEDADKADAESELNLMNILQPYNNHNGGQLAFGPDGFLYIGLGDGGSSGDPDNRGRNPLERLGKILRIDVNQGETYGIPTSNPFYNSSTTLEEIWASGLRNPWRFSFDRLTGDLWIADVGQNKVEEINFQPASSAGGEDYGWRCYEGNEVFNRQGCDTDTSFTFPIYTYPHGSECSVIGGYVFRGSASSTYYGHYFFADWCSDRIWTLHKEGEEWVREDFGHLPGNNFTTFGEDVNGQLYLAGMTSGTIYRVIKLSTGIDDLNTMESVKIIRVPSSGKIRIETGLDSRAEFQVMMSDVKGVQVYRGTMGESAFEFDPGDLPSGVYIVQLTGNGKKAAQKLVIGK